MKTLEVIEIGKDSFVDIPCKCGCSKKILVKLPKYFSTACYAIASSRKHQKAITVLLLSRSPKQQCRKIVNDK